MVSVLGTAADTEHRTMQLLERSQRRVRSK